MHKFNKIAKILMIGLLIWVLFLPVISASTWTYAESDEACLDGNAMFEPLGLLNSLFGVKTTDPNMTLFSGRSLIAELLNMLMFLNPTLLTNDQSCLQSKMEEVPYANEVIGGGVLGTVDNTVTAALYSYPMGVTVGTYIANEWSPSRINSTMAASEGMDMISPVYTLWKMMVQVAYLIFVIVVIAIGFMIMFRQRIGGQVAVNVVNTLPRVLAGLILVHLSFAISAFVINFSLFLMVVQSVMFGAASQEMGLTKVGGRNLLPVGYVSPGSFWWQTTGLITGGVELQDVSEDTFLAKIMKMNPLLGPMGTIRVGIEQGAEWAKDHLPLSTTLQAFFSSMSDLSIGALIIRFILAVGLLYAGFKILFVLIKAYAMIFYKVIIAPLVVAVGSLPGQQSMMVNHFKGIWAESMVFPAVYFFINLGLLIAAYGISHPIAFPKFIGGTTIDEGYGNIAGIIGYVIVLSAASADKIVKELLKVQVEQVTKEVTGSIIQFSSKAPLVGKLASSNMQ